MSAVRFAADDGTTPRALAPILEALLEGGISAGVPVNGQSMLPTLRPGDRIVIAPFLGLPAPGQIVATRTAAGVVAHRLVQVDWRDGRRLYRTQGDALNYLDAGVAREDLLGRVVEIVRAGARLAIDDSPWARRRALFRLALRRRRPRLSRAAAVLLALALGATADGGAARAAASLGGIPEASYAPPPDYKFAAGDVLSLRLWDGEKIVELSMTLQSDGTAFIPLPGLGSVDLGGLTPAGAKKEIENRLGKVYKEIHTELLVSRYAGHKVNLMGEVRTTARTDSGPGEWPLTGTTRLVPFLSAHGGPSPEADLMRVQVIRPTGETLEVNLFRAVFQHSDADNPTLDSGDFVFVPSLVMGNRKVFVLGDVNQPGVVTVYDKMSLVEALARCGGVSKRGTYKEIAVIHHTPDGAPDMQVVDVKELFKTGSTKADLSLSPGDIVFVPRGPLGTIQDVFSIITPALQSIESIYIIDDFVKGNN
ncbi:MAG TPA: SLBB domain-containing protein [Dongiaceae bacterium]|nr:SLBB domain-containing protein [Dongiaceae bacterium]